MGYRFDEETHTYYINNRKALGVTSVLTNSFGNRPYWDVWHAGKGKAVHLAIHYFVQNKLNWASVAPEIMGRMKAFKMFLFETGFTVEKSEVKLYSRRYNFGGTLDLVLRDKNKRLILADIKSTIEPVAELQLAGYSLLYDENNYQTTKKAMLVQLKDNGHYSLHWVDNLRKKARIFVACLTVEAWRKDNIT